MDATQAKHEHIYLIPKSTFYEQFQVVLLTYFILSSSSRLSQLYFPPFRSASVHSRTFFFLHVFHYKTYSFLGFHSQHQGRGKVLNFKVLILGREPSTS